MLNQKHAHHIELFVFINEILKSFDEESLNLIAYVDDVVILIASKYLSIITDLMEGALKKFLNCLSKSWMWMVRSSEKLH